MRLSLLTGVNIFLLIGLVGCNSNNTAIKESPLGSVITGETKTLDKYIGNIKKRNLEDQSSRASEYFKETIRAYNLRTGKYDFVPKDTLQRWNETEKRWEF